MYLRLFLTTMRFMNRSPLQSCNAAEYYGINDHWGGGGGGGGGLHSFFCRSSSTCTATKPTYVRSTMYPQILVTFDFGILVV